MAVLVCRGASPSGEDGTVDSHRAGIPPSFYGDVYCVLARSVACRGVQHVMSHARAVLLTSLPTAINTQIASCAPDGFVTTICANTVSDEEKINVLKDANFLLIHPGTIAAHVLRSAPKLKLVQLLRVGYELMDTTLLKELSIPFATIGNAASGLVADHTVLLMLAVYRNLVLSDTSVKTGRWDAAIRERQAYEMDGKCVGILGMGNIGKQVTRRVQGFGCNVQYY